MKLKLTPELNEQITKYIEAGNYIKIACRMVGISRSTHYNWMERGKKALELEEKGKKVPESEKVYLDYLDTIKKAEATAIVRNVLIIQTAAKKTWQAAAWWLERAHYKDYGIKKQIGGTGDEPIKIEIKNKDLEDELKKQLNIIRKRVNAKKRKKQQK